MIDLRLIGSHARSNAHEESDVDISRAFVVDAGGAREEIDAARSFVETVRGQTDTSRDG